MHIWFGAGFKKNMGGELASIIVFYFMAFERRYFSIGIGHTPIGAILDLIERYHLLH